MISLYLTICLASLQSTSPEPTACHILKAQYSWEYAGADGQGKGTVNLMLNPGNKSLILELFGLGERIALISGDVIGGYRVQIPRKSVDVTSQSLGDISLPFLSKFGSVEKLYKFLLDGDFPGVKVTKKDNSGPVKLKYTGSNEHGKEYQVWLKRERWEFGSYPTVEQPESKK